MISHENTPSHAIVPLLELFLSRSPQYADIHFMRKTSFIFTLQFSDCHAQ
jgi:hypothetical protein